MVQWNLLMLLNVLLIVLGIIVVLLISYMVIRLAVTHALRAHTRWVDDGKP